MNAFARRAAAPVFTLAILSSAALIFILQPLFSRMTTPLLGGSPAVWNTSMVFFQGALLVGYAYAHLLTRVKDLRLQALVHALMLAFGALSLPIAAPLAGPENSAAPQLWLLGVLALAVGAPYAVACATAPLLQAWYARTGREDAHDPYYLYAASNVGSLGGLIAYPLLIEPNTGLEAQRLSWSLGYASVALLILASVVLALTAKGAAPLKAAEQAARPRWSQRLFWLVAAALPSSLLLGVTLHISTDVASAPFLWVAPLALYLITFIVAFARGGERLAPLMRLLAPMSLGALILSYAIFNHWPVQLAANLSAFFICALACHLTLARTRPEAARLTEFYLWVSLGGVVGGAATALLAPIVFNDVYEYPLALAAIAVVVARGGEPNAWPRLTTALLAGSLALLVPSGLLLAHSPQRTALFCAAIGAAASLICAGLLERRIEKGDPARPITLAFFLTALASAAFLAFATASSDWLFLETQSVEGGRSYTMVAHWGWVLGGLWLLNLGFLIRTASAPARDQSLGEHGLAIASGVGLAFVGLGVSLAVYGADLLRAVIYYASLAFIAIGFVLNGARPWALGAMVLAAFVVIYADDQRNLQIVSQDRSFFGVLRVVDYPSGSEEEGDLRVLYHGTTIHGAQLTGELAALRPLTYYNPSTSLGEAAARAARANRPAHLGLIGLGAGATACLLWNEEDDLTIFEIDPEVVALSVGEGARFTYVNGCAPDADVRVGDARLMVQREPDGAFDVLVVDAFSSDAIPAHLLTREAVAGYMDKIGAGGAVVLHLSNRNMSLVLEASRVAHELGLTAIWRTSAGDERAGVFGYGALPATTMVLAKSPEALAAMRFHQGEWCIPPVAPGRAWSDDYINVPRALYEHFSGLESALIDGAHRPCQSPPGLLPARKRLS